ncbi:MAG TPA: transcriptional regulator FtrA [Pseudoxanthomonas sp.]|nr:transcriptional regulator FtrA [Pseudoxanthomonas sp.]
MQRSNPARRARDPSGTPGLVAALAYDGLCLFEFGIAAELFGLPRPELERPWYRFRAVAVDRRVRTGVGGWPLQADAGLEALARARTIVVPGWKGVDVPPSPPLRQALVRAHRRGARLLSICSGAFLLGHCGLLAGRRATTHWRYEAAFRAAFPDAEFVPDVLYVDEGTLITSAGSAAGIDACLHLIRRDHGAAVANQVARRLVLPAHREGGQRQFVPAPVQPRPRGRFDAVFDWARARLHLPLQAADLAGAAAMSERNFYRRFRAATGLTPAAWLQQARLARARELLETGDAPLERIAEAAGFRSGETFRAAFRRGVGVSPTAYRRSFGR